MGYDVVIVGVGSAGSVLAGQLSANPNRTVLGIEAGPAYTADTRPESVQRLDRPFDPAHDWAHEAQTVDGRTLPYTRGRVVGGSSTINAGMALRAVPDDVDAWGVDGWRWADLLPHFVAIEHDRDFVAPYHGTAGPVPIMRHTSEELGGLHAAFVERGGDLGFGYVADQNAPDSRGGVGPVPMNRDGRQRVSAADAFLYPVLDRPNLTLWGDALVEHIVLSGGRAVALDVLRGGVRERVEAGEIVLCGGVIQSPALLLRSGLDHPGIGANLSDHPACPVHLTPRDEVERRGPGMRGILRVPSPVTGRPFGLWMVLTAASPVPTLPGTAPTFLPSLYLSPQEVGTRGRVSLADDGDVRIDWPFLDDPATIAELRAGVRLAAELVVDGALAKLLSGLHVDLDLADAAAIDAFVRANHQAFLHGSGTCALGDVVDEQLRVRGVDGLRVCDTSVFPTVPRANPNLTVMAVAHRAATFF